MAPITALVAQQAKEARAAQERMDKAVTDGQWTDRNIHMNEGIKAAARSEWDTAAENCRRTPGCNPVIRNNTTVDGHKPLRTDREIIKEIAKSGGITDADDRD
jgi:hypothetical protein